MVRPEVGKKNFTGVRSDIGEGVKDVTVQKGSAFNFVVTRAMRVRG